jgi:quercetin dioxygenase-like cupin family protein
MIHMSAKPVLLLAFLITSLLIVSSPLRAEEAVSPSFISKNLAGVAGKEIQMYTVDFPPGHSIPAHRHNAQVFLYVLEGSLVTQVKGGKEITLAPGQSYYENPDDIHTVTRNASNTKPAKFLVLMIKEKGAPSTVMEK